MAARAIQGLLPVIDALAPLRGPDTLIPADACDHSERHTDALTERNISALTADTALRSASATIDSWNGTGTRRNPNRCTTGDTTAGLSPASRECREILHLVLVGKES